ncbi:MAG: hypothetical protein LBS85_07460 [Clostridiales Family XIII bacterium]|jgi:hypothetical protein|nr:hypothetical protein [Clostridiales Family XIII bacterium]
MSVSFYCSPTHLKLLIGSTGASGITISDYAEYPLPEGGMINGIITDQDIMTRYFHDIGNQLGLFREEAYLVVDNNSIRSKVMDLPPVAEAKMLEFIKRELSAAGDESANDVFDYAVLSPKAENGGARILAVAVNRELLETYRSVLVSAGFDLKHINIGVNAKIRAAAVMPQLRTGTSILAMVDEKAFILSMFENGRYRITNKYRLMTAENTPEWHTEIGNHLSAMVQFQKSQRSDSEISAAYFAGITPRQTELLASALGYLGIQLLGLDFASITKLTGNAAAKQAEFTPGKYLLNIGTMLRK